MDNLNELVELLHSDNITGLMYDFYRKYEERVHPKWRNPDLFIKYLKAYYVEKYIGASEAIKNVMISDLKNNDLAMSVTQVFLDKINSSVAKQNQNMEGVYLDEFEDLLQLIDDPNFEDISEYNKYIMEIVRDTQGFVLFDDIKTNDTTPSYGYKFTDEDIRAIKNAKLVPEINRFIHSLYDEYTFSGVKCNYDAIENETLKRFAFHTNNNNPELKILFKDGTIIYYEKGDIKICPIDFFHLVLYVKLQIVYYYNYANEEDEDFDYKASLYGGIEAIDFLDVPFNELEDSTRENLILMAADEVCGEVDCLLNNYSKKMIEDSKKEIVKMNEHVKKYKL